MCKDLKGPAGSGSDPSAANQVGGISVYGGENGGRVSTISQEFLLATDVC